MKKIEENMDYMVGSLANELTERFSDVLSKRIDQRFPQTEESNVQIMKRNLVNPGEPPPGELDLVNFCFILMIC